jgi:arylsulfatase A-like enzyme
MIVTDLAMPGLDGITATRAILRRLPLCDDELLARRRGDALPLREGHQLGGAFRVPCLVRWPGAIKPGTVTCEMMSHNDWIRALCSIAGEPDIVNKLKQGYTANGIRYKVHPDGYDHSASPKAVDGTPGKNSGAESARDNFFSADGDGALVAYRKGDYKYVFEGQRLAGTMGVWAEPSVPGSLRAGGHHAGHVLGLAHQPRRTRLRRDG